MTKAHDSLTVLTSAGPVLTKTWRADGTIESYGRAKHFTVETVPVSNIHELAAVLQALEQQPTKCVIRGEPREGVGQDGRVQRTLQNFQDVPRRWVMLDVDGWDAGKHNIDPVAEPEEAVRAFVNEALPVEFRGVACFWQLSSSAGSPGKEHLLKAHLWFWLDRPIGGEVLERWAMALRLPVDSTVFRTVQVHYVAAPVIEPGASCPVRRRSGLIEGVLDDEVALEVPENLTLPPANRSGRTEMFNPTEHRGLRGAFNSVFTPIRCVQELLAGVVEFETDESSPRLTWLKSSSGTPGGITITDDELHFYNSHAGDPCEGKAVDAWTFCRHHLFDGDHEEMRSFAEGIEEVVAAVRTASDDFEDLPDEDPPSPGGGREDPESPEVPSHPSNTSASSRREEVRNERLERVESYRARIREAADVEALKELGGSIGADESIDDVDRHGIFVGAVQDRWRELTGNRLPVATARTIVGVGRRGGGGGDDGDGGGGPVATPDWAEKWVRIGKRGRYINLETLGEFDTGGFDNANCVHVPPGQNGDRPLASMWLLRNGIQLRTVDEAVYAPGEDRIFDEDGASLFNEWKNGRPAPSATRGKASTLVEEHLKRIYPNDRDRGLLISWMAHIARNPGVKVKWTPYLFGKEEGTGKTLVFDVLSAVLGKRNVKTAETGEIASGFNTWATGAELVCVEEIHQVGEFLNLADKFKAPITNELISINRKGKDAVTIRNRTNFLILSNRSNAIPVTEQSRRYFFLRPRITEPEAKALSNEGYYTRLFDAIKAPGGGADLYRWLLDAPAHPEFNPNGRAPETEDKLEAIEAVRSDVEVVLRHAIGDGKAFFVEWASELLKQSEIRVPQGRAWSSLAADLGFRAGAHAVWVGGKTKRIIRAHEAAGWSSEELIKEANRVQTRYADAGWEDEEAAGGPEAERAGAEVVQILRDQSRVNRNTNAKEKRE